MKIHLTDEQVAILVGVCAVALVVIIGLLGSLIVR